MAAVVAPRATGGERFSAGECAADAPNIVLEVSRRGNLTDVPATALGVVKRVPTLVRRTAQGRWRCSRGTEITALEKPPRADRWRQRRALPLHRDAASFRKSDATRA